MQQNKVYVRRFVIVGLVIAMVLTLASCLPGDVARYTEKPAGFLMGIWHPETRIYEVNNTGWWYDFGFYMAIISGFGGLSLGRKNRKHDNKSDS
jgi:hypothetical protein